MREGLQIPDFTSIGLQIRWSMVYDERVVKLCLGG